MVLVVDITFFMEKPFIAKPSNVLHVPFLLGQLCNWQEALQRDVFPSSFQQGCLESVTDLTEVPQPRVLYLASGKLGPGLWSAGARGRFIIYKLRMI